MSGESSAGGHFVAHLRHLESDQWYTANDKFAIQPSTNWPEFKVERFMIFLYKLKEVKIMFS